MRKLITLGTLLFIVAAKGEPTNPNSWLVMPAPGAPPIKVVIKQPENTPAPTPVQIPTPLAQTNPPARSTPVVSQAPILVPTNSPSQTSQTSESSSDLKTILAQSSVEHIQTETNVPPDLRVPDVAEDTNTVVYDTLPALVKLDPTGEYVSRYVSIPGQSNEPPRLIRFDIPVFRDKN